MRTAQRLEAYSNRFFTERLYNMLRIVNCSPLCDSHIGVWPSKRLRAESHFNCG